MSYFLGIDTSNYTTSVAIYDDVTDKVIHRKKLLPVAIGEKGIRQSDAVFHHTQQVSDLLKSLYSELDVRVDAVACSARPRSVKGSYMPCFTVGETLGTAIAITLGVPCRLISHQEGHIVAALYSAGAMELMGQEFLAFHVSGGTTESLFVSPDDRTPVAARLLTTSSDLKAGQAIDRVGQMLGLPFPAGPEFEKLALQSTREFKIRVSSKDGNPSLSGVENKCKDMIARGEAPEDVALFCLKYIEAALIIMVDYIREAYPDLPIVFSGGVMSNSILQRSLAQHCGTSYFATPEFSADNAAGVAILAKENFR